MVSRDKKWLLDLEFNVQIVPVKFIFFNVRLGRFVNSFEIYVLSTTKSNMTKKQNNALYSL